MAAALIELLETAVGLGAGRQSELRAIHAKVLLCVWIAVGVHDRHDGGRASVGGDFVGVP